jgi:glycosyltransferase involved in cell wall biosynthesis
MLPQSTSSHDGVGIVCLVFSKDRPLQLDATLRSLELNCADLGLSTIRVLYTTSSPNFAAQYRVLANEHSDVVFVREVQFRSDLVELAQGSAHVMFLVDDTLFVGPLSLARTIQLLDEDPACLGFSFRLGRNTTYCYTLDLPQRLPAFEELDSGVLTFDWTDAEHDFGYPLEVSSSLYRTSDLLPLLVELDYRNPNMLESTLAQHADSFREAHPRLACYGRSVALSVPANLVQTAWKNRIDSNPALTAEALAVAYARGQRLDVERYRGFVANACHQELEFAYKKDPDIPTVSVIIPCYRQAEFLQDAIDSVLQQTYTDWDIVIVDDGSPDDTTERAKAVAAAHRNLRISVITTTNRGLALARNRAIELARGRYILPLDADDKIAPRMLEQCVALLEQQRDIAIAYTDLQQFGAGHELVRAADFDPNIIPVANQLNYCSLYRREVWEAVGGYNPNMVQGYEDWDFWVGAVEHGYRARRIPEPLFSYRIRPGSMYSEALSHDAQLQRQIRENHPSLYTLPRRVIRRGRIKAGSWWARLRSRFRRGLRAIGSRDRAQRQ